MKVVEGPKLDIVYRPVWEVDKPSVDLFLAHAIMVDEDHNPIPGEEPLARQDSVEATMARQVKYLTQAFEAMKMRFARGDRFRLMVRVNSVAIATKECAAEITECFRILNKEERDNVAVMITDFPKSLSVETMDDITIPLMPFFDTLVAMPEQEQTDYTLYANLNYAGVMLDLKDKPIDLKLAGKILQLFSSRAEFRRLPMWIIGIPTQEVAKVARIAGAQVLSGAYMDYDSMLPGPPLEGNQPFMV